MMKRIFGYVKKFPHGQLVVDLNFHQPKLLVEPVDYDWQEFYPDADTEVPPGIALSLKLYEQ